MNIDEVINKQKDFFISKKTLDIKCRINALKNLYNKINERINDIYKALYLDLGKGSSESYMCEVGLVLNEISFMLKNIKKFSKPKKVKTPLSQFHSKSYTVAYPYGCVLIMSPWNYPFLLSMDPLVEAIASGNTVILKPSRYSEHTSCIIKEIIEGVFNEEYVKVYLGGHDVNQLLINKKYDFVFFTGSKNVGQIVYEAAAKNLTPIVLELGGKSPCIIDEKVNLKLTARRLVWGKFINLGQTCVAPDYVLCHKNVYDDFIKELEKEIIRQFGEDALHNPEYGKMINLKHFNRAIGLLDSHKTYYGGKYDSTTLKIEPTIMTDVTLDDSIMKEEIFAPILPIIKVDDLSSGIEIINKLETPLAFYVFSKNKKNIKYLISNCEFGGGCVNDTVVHLANSNLGFGGFKESGMGRYHGKEGYMTFSHYKSVLDKKLWIDLPMRYKPKSNIKDKLVKAFLK
ncbi:MAG: aldehyde dehydrogenase [Anaeroplasma sp.]